jgi:hypothetical protein
MTSHRSSEDGNALTHTDGLAREGFPRILWEVLQGAGYLTPPQYAVQQFEKHRVPRCRVRMTLEPHPLQPGWRSLDSESFGYRAEDTIEAIALHGLTTFCGFHPLELSTHPIGLFPAEREDDPMWKDRVEHAKDIWALYPGHTAHLSVRCMNALYRLQVMRGEVLTRRVDWSRGAYQEGGLEAKRHYACSRQSRVTEWVGCLPWLRVLSVCVERERVVGCIYSWVYVV